MNNLGYEEYLRRGDIKPSIKQSRQDTGFLTEPATMGMRKRQVKEFVGPFKMDSLNGKNSLWNTFHAREHVKPITKKQLGLWGIDYFDLFLVHFPIALQYVDPNHRYPPEWFDDHGRVQLQNTPLQETWAAMEELVDVGYAKNIGL
ncbi:hypothetical protein C0992_002213, partial [Termitomyces sp. T32_za158]